MNKVLFFVYTCEVHNFNTQSHHCSMFKHIYRLHRNRSPQSLNFHYRCETGRQVTTAGRRLVQPVEVLRLLATEHRRSRLSRIHWWWQRGGLPSTHLLPTGRRSGMMLAAYGRCSWSSFPQLTSSSPTSSASLSWSTCWPIYPGAVGSSSGLRG